jgi:hypothetical protein
MLLMKLKMGQNVKVRRRGRVRRGTACGGESGREGTARHTQHCTAMFSAGEEGEKGTGVVS